MAADAPVTWRIKGEEVMSCNCDWGCPCQFNANPTHGNCYALVGFSINEGDFDGVDLSGVRFAEAVSWPGAIHEGDGTVQLFLDESASDEQRDAVGKIASGQYGGAYFEIFSSVLPHAREPIVAPIEITSDRETRRASVRVGDAAHWSAEPITNPVTGDEHRVRIDIPDGFEYSIAEIANTVGSSVTGEVPLDFTLDGTHAQLNEFDFSNG